MKRYKTSVVDPLRTKRIERTTICRRHKEKPACEKDDCYWYPAGTGYCDVAEALKRDSDMAYEKETRDITNFLLTHRDNPSAIEHLLEIYPHAFLATGAFYDTDGKLHFKRA